MILLIDNFDSFTFNLVHAFEVLGKKVCVLRNDEVSIDDIKKINPSHIVISPGPGWPREAGVSCEVIDCLKEDYPILGVCLGHQAIGDTFGAKVVRSGKLMHGLTSKILHIGEGVFKEIPQRVEMMRYHSLVIDPDTLNSGLYATAWTEDNLIMGIAHINYPKLHGVQFHPESFKSEWGWKVLQNFLNI